MKKFRRFIIGSFAIVLLFSIFDGLVFLMISIVCTAGVTLVAYVPLAYYIGLGIENLFISMSANEEGNILFANNATTSSVNSEITFGLGDQTLVKYIKDARAIGMSDDVIKQNLYEHGWQQVQVEKIFEMLANLR